MTRFTSVVAAQLIIIQVCNGRRRTGFGYYWEFPHRGRPMRLEKRKKRGVAIPTSICSVAADGIPRTVGADDNFGLTMSDMGVLAQGAGHSVPVVGWPQTANRANWANLRE